ncbi:RNA polymerase sigma factor [Membranihabitans maritimus]|uniref:RNA polymerase sigma factor n=1 Tax=Membranihabitans maritimus TaxID=2904244 RepID=UPI001F32B18F|nr:RNA polymerase sigma factor [Membranihabitans maritimus]
MSSKNIEGTSDSQQQSKVTIPHNLSEFKQMFDQNWEEKVYNFAFEFTKSRQVSDRIVKVTQSKIWEERKRITKAKPMEASIHEIVKNLIFNHFQSVSRTPLKRKELWAYFLEKNIEHLWKKFIKGDKKVFKDIYLYFYPNLYGYGKVISNDTDTINNAIHDLFLRLWENPPKQVQSIKGYVFISFRRQLIRLLKTSSRQLKVLNDQWPMEQSTPSPEENLINSEFEIEINSFIEKILDALPSRQKEAIYLKYFENKSTIEISAIMNIREEGVRNYMYIGIKSLRKIHTSSN